MRPLRWSLLLLALTACTTFDHDLPLVEIAPAHHGAPLAVIVTGDGGWRALDRNVAAGLHDRGYGVVALVASRYFAERRTPQESAKALQRIVSLYGTRWQSRQVVAIGYSRGAGVLPFMINRLPAVWRNRITTIALMGLSPTIDFHVSTFDLTAEIPVRGEIEKLRGKRILCFYGEHESDSLCRALPPSLAISIVEPGGHHFAGNYDSLARTIWRWRGV